MKRLLSKIGYAVYIIGIIFLILAVLCMNNVIFNRTYVSKFCLIAMVINIVATILMFFPFGMKKEQKNISIRNKSPYVKNYTPTASREDDLQSKPNHTPQLIFYLQKTDLLI